MLPLLPLLLLILLPGDYAGKLNLLARELAPKYVGRILLLLIPGNYAGKLNLLARELTPKYMRRIPKPLTTAPNVASRSLPRVSFPSIAGPAPDSLTLLVLALKLVALL